MQFWANSSVRVRLVAGFSPMVVLVLLTGLVGYFGTSRIQAGFDTVFDVRLPAHSLLLEADRDLHQLLVAERSMLSVEPSHPKFQALVKEYQDNLEQSGTRWAKYKALPLSDAERAIAASYDAARAKWLPVSESVVRARQSGTGNVSDVSLVEAKKLFDEMREHMNQLEEINDKASEETHAGVDVVYRRQTLTLIAASVAGLVMGLLLAWFVSNGIVRRIRALAYRFTEGTDQVTHAAAQVASASQSVSQGATEQAASLEKTSASMEEMASMTRGNADSAEQAARLMDDVKGQVGRTNALLGDMVASMQSIKVSSDKVAKIIKTIDEIAFQTNILALNAAVEAARAGEAGMGFAVVADEVRNLAQRAAQAARDTTTLIDEASGNATSGAQKVEVVAGAIAQLTESVGEVGRIAGEVSSASREQAQGIGLVTQALGDIEKVTQSTAASAEESAAASEELSAQSEATRQLVDELSLLAGTSPAAVAQRLAHRRPADTDGKVMRLVQRAAPRRNQGDGTFGG